MGYNLWIMDWDGSNRVNITPWGREKYQPAWTPDGNSLLHCSDLMGDCEVFALNPDGSDNRDLTWSSGSSDMAPAPAPDGKSVAFISNRNGKFELFLMDNKGFNQRRILSLEGDIREPSWGANNLIAFGLEKDGASHLFTVAPDGSGLRQLTDGPSWDGQASWNHDGSKLAFSSNRSGSPDLWTFELATGKLANVTNTPDNDEFFPHWVPKQISDKPLAVAEANPSKMDLPRPRMLFRQEDIPAIKARLATEPYATSWKVFLSKCDGLLKPSPLRQTVEKSIQDTKNNNALGLYNTAAWIDATYSLAFAWQITGEKRYADQAVAWLLAAAEEHRQNLGTFQLEYPTACAYDWLYTTIPSEPRARLTKLMQVTTNLNYLGIANDKEGLGQLSKGMSNFGVYMAAMLGPAALALAGEPGSNPNTLAAAERLTCLCLNNWLDAKGSCVEGFSYFASPMNQLMPFLVSLKANHLCPEAIDSNLKNFPQWMAASAAKGVTETINIGDADFGSLNIPEGALSLYPDNPLLMKLWNNVPKGAAPTPVVTSLLWWRPSEGKPQDFSDVPTAAVFPLQGYAVLKSGHGKDDLMMTLCDPSFPGHTHAEAGSITLCAFGTRFLTDLGQGCGEAKYHSQPLVNGRGRGFSFKALSRPAISLDAQGQLGALATADLKPPFASRADNHKDYTIPSPWTPLRHGTRQLALVNKPQDQIPPYYLLYDDIDADGKTNTYTQLFTGDLDKQFIAGDHQLTIRPAFDGPWLNPVPGKPGKVAFAFDTKSQGTFQLWIYTQAPSKLHRVIIDGKQHGGARWITPTREACWQWTTFPDGKGQPLTLSLEPGRHILEVGNEGSVFARLALTPPLPDPGLFSQGPTPDVPVLLKAEDGKINNGWTLEPAGKSPEVLLSFLNPEPVSFTQSKLSYRTRFYGQKLVILPQAQAEVKAVNPQALVLVYPHTAEMETPAVTSGLVDGVPAAGLKWKNALDKVKIINGAISVTREYPDGTKATL